MTMENFKKKWENYWYHYKWHTWAAVFIVLVLIVCIKSMVDKPRYDYEIMLINSKGVMDDAVTAMEEELAKYGEDLNGDGEVTVGVVQNTFNPSDPAGSQINMVSQTKIMAMLQTGETMVFITDDASYDTYQAQNIFTRLDGQKADENTSKEEIAYNYQGTVLQERMTQLGYPESLNFTIRVVEGTPLAKKEKMLAYYEQSKALLDRFIAAQK